MYILVYKFLKLILVLEILVLLKVFSTYTEISTTIISINSVLLVMLVIN